MINFKALGQRIREERKNRDLTQEKFSEILDISPEHLSRIESGYRPSLALIEKISDVFGVGEAELMFGTPSEKKEAKALMDKISALDLKKRLIAEHIIDEIAEL